MRDSLDAVLKYSAQQYSSLLGVEIEQQTHATPDNRPIWQWQTDELKSTSSSESAAGAVILDSEIGLCLFIQEYDPRADIRGQLTRALQIRSELAPTRQTSAEEADQLGEWSVALYWLVSADSFTTWINQIAEIRQETASFEEVTVDAIVNWESDWSLSLANHALPRLLFNTRAALRRTKWEDTERWLSADQLVIERVRQLSDAFPRSLNEFSSKFRRHFEEEISRPRKRETITAQPTALHRIAIQKFRNIERLTMELRGQDDLVSVNVIQGPNGTGKSSIYEALSIVTGRTSNRYVEFIEDINEPNYGKSQKYLERYLSPLGEQSLGPRLSLNSSELKPIELTAPDEAREACEKLSGTFLSQSWSENLLKIKASDLGAQIAGSYSDLATTLLEFLDEQIRSSENERSSFNRTWGLRGNVSNEDTARSRITDQVISEFMRHPDSIVNWLETASRFETKFTKDLIDLHDRWKQWNIEFQSKVDRVSRQQNVDALGDALHTEATGLNALLLRTNEVTNQFRNVVQPISQSEYASEQSLNRFVEKYQNLSKVTSIEPDKIRVLKSQILELQDELSALTRRGTTKREQLAQLKNVRDFISRHWAIDDHTNCPICDTNLSAHGGIAEVIESNYSIVEKELIQLREEYAATSAKLDTAGQELSIADPSSIASEEGGHILEAALQNLLPDFRITDLKSREFENTTRQILRFVRERLPPAVMSYLDEELEKHVKQAAAKIWSAYTQFTEVSTAPEAWKDIHKRLVSELAVIISEHLPKTIQALWWEVARNIMPAPWQYPGSVEFNVEQRRATTEARLVVHGKAQTALAAHILNGAELHNLGLAWFLTRYLTKGRFSHSFLVLDDPANQMDQPTFRDLCRLLEALRRMHKQHEIPMTLVLLLHQDDRALDAARATDGVLHLLRWHRGASTLVTKMRMRVSPISPRKPYRVLQSA